MNILVVSNMYPDKNHPSYGIFVKKFCEQLKNTEINVDKCVLLKNNVKYYKIINYIIFYIKALNKILFGNYNIIYVHYPSFSGAPVLWVSKIKKITVYSNLHGSDVVPETIYHRKMQKYTLQLLRLSSKIIVPSEYFKEYVSEKYNLNKHKIFIYPSGGINPKIFYRKDSSFKQKLIKKYSLKKETIIFGMAGRISTDKGWDVFINAIHILVKNGIKANYLIIGDGIEKDKMNVLIKKKNLKKEIVWVQKLISQKELSEFYSGIDYLVFPTKREGESLGLVAIEAMACGTPVIASNYAAPKYYVKNGENGFKFTMGDANSLAETMIKGISYYTDKRINKLRNGACKTAKNYLDENIKDNLIKILKN